MTEIQDWLLVLAPYFAVVIPTLLSMRNGRKADIINKKVDEVHALTNGNIARIEALARQDADNRVAAVEAAALDPVNIAAAADKVRLAAEVAKGSAER